MDTMLTKFESLMKLIVYEHTCDMIDENKYYLEILVFYQLCHLSLVILVLSLAIPGLSLAVRGPSLLVLNQFQDVPDSSCLTFI